MSLMVRVIRAMTQPELIAKHLFMRLELVPFEFRLNLDAFQRPWFAYCMWHAARLARQLGLEELSVMEFGVARGGGLLELEKLADEIEKYVRIRFRIYGFDLGTGLPKPTDYRDLPYVFRSGMYRMDERALRKRLNRSTLVIGNVEKTIPEFLSREKPPPIGFISFDLDYHSSTRDAFAVFEGSHEFFLPRVFCYFDDVIGSDDDLHCDYVGELLAIGGFNEAHANQKICKIHGLAQKRPFPCPWAEKVYALHRFTHDQYNSDLGLPE